MPMDYPAIDFDEQGQWLIARGNFKGLFFRKIPYIINQKKKKNPIVMPIDIVVFLYFPFFVCWKLKFLYKHRGLFRPPIKIIARLLLLLT